MALPASQAAKIGSSPYQRAVDIRTVRQSSEAVARACWPALGDLRRAMRDRVAECPHLKAIGKRPEGGRVARFPSLT
jgi:hypothetical protein